jgi:hypothetical protein
MQYDKDGFAFPLPYSGEENTVGDADADAYEAQLCLLLLSVLVLLLSIAGLVWRCQRDVLASTYQDPGRYEINPDRITKNVSCVMVGTDANTAVKQQEQHQQQQQQQDRVAAVGEGVRARVRGSEGKPGSRAHRGPVLASVASSVSSAAGPV